MRFFAMKEQFGIHFFFTEVASTHVPLRRSDVRKMLLDLDGYSRLSYLQRNHCLPVEDSKAKKKAPCCWHELVLKLYFSRKKAKK